MRRNKHSPQYDLTQLRVEEGDSVGRHLISILREIGGGRIKTNIQMDRDETCKILTAKVGDIGLKFKIFPSGFLSSNQIGYREPISIEDIRTNPGKNEFTQAVKNFLKLSNDQKILETVIDNKLIQNIYLALINEFGGSKKKTDFVYIELDEKRRDGVNRYIKLIHKKNIFELHLDENYQITGISRNGRDKLSSLVGRSLSTNGENTLSAQELINCLG